MADIIVTKNNFATVLNLQKIGKDTLNSFNNELGNFNKEITEMYIREQQKEETIKQVETLSEIGGIGTDIAKDFINKSTNENIALNITYKFLEESRVKEDKEKINKFFNFNSTETKENILANEIKQIVTQNEEYLRNNNVFTDEEFNKILHGGTNNIPELFNYDLNGGGTALDMQKDVVILNKCCSCMLKNDNEYIFKDLLVIDGSGQAVNPELINKSTLKYILNFGLLDENSERNKKAIQFLTMSAEIRSKTKDFAKIKGNSNLLKLCKRLSGMDTLKKEVNQYTNQLKPFNYAKKAVKTTEKATVAAYKGYKFGNLFLKQLNLKKLKKNKDVKKALAKYNEIKSGKKAFNSFENKVSAIRHPLRHNISKLANKFKQSEFAKKVAGKLSRTPFGAMKSARDVALSKVYKVAGKVINPVVQIIRAVVIKVAIALSPIIIFFLIFIISGIAASTSTTTGSMMTIMPLANQSDFDEYQKKYDELDDNFLMSLENYLAEYAINKNLKGEQIRYGINGQNNEDGMQNDDFYNGMYYRFWTDEEHAGRSSNIEDLISIMAIMMTQSQADHRDIALKVIEWLYDISHTYTYTESPLYACNSACHNIHYECNDNYHDYSDTDIRFNPFHALKKSGGDYEIREAPYSCEVCRDMFEHNKSCPSAHIASIDNPTKEDYYGCVSDNQCFHGDDGNMGRSRGTCTHYIPHPECGHECEDENCSHDCSNNPIGCAGYWECIGHPHYICKGHDFKCCMGHRDVQMNIHIKFYEEIKDIINNYDFGENDIYYKEINNIE